MSRTAAVRFRDRGIWTQTEVLQVFAGLLVEAAMRCEACDEPWFAESIEEWRVQASVQDFGLGLRDDWSPVQVDVVIAVIDEVRQEMTGPGAEDWIRRPGWSVLDELAVGGEVMARSAGGVARVAEALELMLRERLPPDPEGAWWFVCDDGPWRQIRMGPPGWSRSFD